MRLAEWHDVSELIVLPHMCCISSHRKLDIVNCSSTRAQVGPVSVALAFCASQLFVDFEFPVPFQLDQRKSTGIKTELWFLAWKLLLVLLSVQQIIVLATRTCGMRFLSLMLNI